MSVIKINNLKLSPLLVSNTDILPCLNICYFEKKFIPLQTVKIYKNDNSSIHIDITGNNSSMIDPFHGIVAKITFSLKNNRIDTRQIVIDIKAD